MKAFFFLLAWLVAGGTRLPPEGTLYLDPQGRFELRLPEGWRLSPNAPAPAHAMAAFSHEPTGQVLVVTRLVGPTENPHDTGTLKTILAGLRGSARGYRLISARARDLKLRDKRPPAVYDAWLGATRHRARVVMGARFLVYQSHVLALMIEVPRGSRDLRSARRIVESFRPARR